MAPDSTGGRHGLVTVERIESRIWTVRGCRVMVDSDLAELYGVSVKRLNEQVKRNAHRFPPDFTFQMTRDEYDSLRSHFATLERGRGRHGSHSGTGGTPAGAQEKEDRLPCPRKGSRLRTVVVPGTRRDKNLEP